MATDRPQEAGMRRSRFYRPSGGPFQNTVLTTLQTPVARHGHKKKHSWKVVEGMEARYAWALERERDPDCLLSVEGLIGTLN